MELTYKNNEEEALELYKYLHKSQTALKKYRVIVALALIVLSIGLSVANYFMRRVLIRVHNGMNVDDAIYVFAPVVIGIIISGFYLLILMLTVKENFESEVKKFNIDFEEEKILKLDEKYINYSLNGVNIKYNRENIKKLVEKENKIFIVFKDNKGIVIPNNAFESEELKGEFKKYFI